MVPAYAGTLIEIVRRRTYGTYHYSLLVAEQAEGFALDYRSITPIAIRGARQLDVQTLRIGEQAASDLSKRGWEPVALGGERAGSSG